MPLQGDVLVSGAGTLTLTTTHSVYVYNGSAAAAWTMPALSGNTGEILYLYNRGTGVVTVNRAGSDQFYNGGSLVTNVALAPGGELQIMNDGTYWLVMIGGGGQLVNFDAAAQSADHQTSSVASGVATTWTHPVAAANSFGIVKLAAQSIPAGTTAAVTFGGVTLTPVVPNANGTWVFVGSGIAAGSQTVSVTLSGHTCTYTGFSYSYQNVAAAGAALLNPADLTGSLIVELVRFPRTSPAPGRLWLGVVGASNQPASYSMTKRQSHASAGSNLQTVDGDIGICGAEPTPAIVYWSQANFPGTPVSVLGLELAGTLPIGPYLKSVGPGMDNYSGATNWVDCIPVGANYLLVAISNWPANSLSAVTCGGQAMSVLSSVNYNGDATGASGRGVLFGLVNPPTGMQTISIGSQTNPWSANSFSYAQVSTVATPAAVTGTTTAMSQTATCLFGQLVFQMFGTRTNGAPVMTDNYAHLWQQAFTESGTTGQAGIAVNQSALASSTFTATNGGSQPWGGLSAVLS